MRFSFFLLPFAAFAAAIPTNPSPTPSEPILLNELAPTGNVSFRGAIKCETTMGSPFVVDIDKAIADLNGRGGVCKQSNGFNFGSHCKQVASAGTAQISVCGTFNHWLPCTEVARGANEVKTRCRWNGRAGGKWDFDGNALDSVVH